MSYEHQKKWRSKNKEKVHAHRIVYMAKRKKAIVALPCFCGEKKTQAHHDDYSRPLLIRWLCKKHHVEADIIRRPEPLKKRDHEPKTPGGRRLFI